jgi:hypothetical protein
VTKASRRFYRTTLLSLTALGGMVWTAVDQFGISQKEIAALFLGILWVVAGIIVAAALFAGLWIGLRKYLNRGESD